MSGEEKQALSISEIPTDYTQADLGTCRRCGGTATEPLLFKSNRGCSRICLCTDCFELTQTLYCNLILLNQDVAAVKK